MRILILLLLSVSSFGQMRMAALAGNRSIQTPYTAVSLFSELFDSAPSTLTITDPSTISSVAGGRLKWVGDTGGTSGFLGTTSYTRINGRAIRFSYAHESYATGLHRAGWGTTLSSAVTGMALHANGYQQQYVTGNHRTVKRAPNDVWSILRTTGHFVCTQDKLLFVSNSGTDTNLKPLLWISTAQRCDFDLTAVDGFNLTKNGGADWEDLIKFSSVTTPTSPQSGTTANGNSYIEFTWTAATSAVLNIQFRRTDSNNSWVVKVDEAADKIYLYERVAGVETERGATGGTAVTLTNGVAYRIEVVADDRLITSSFDAVKKIEYENATTDLTNQTATGVLISGFTTASNFIIWKRDIAGLLPRAQEVDDHDVFFVGDSKTAGNINTTDMVAETLWYLSDLTRGRFWENPGRMALSGANTQGWAAIITSEMASRSGNPIYCPYNLGANDVTAMPSETNWKMWTLQIIDAIHVKWPNCQIYMMRPWRITYNTECDTLAGWIADIIALRSSFVHSGPDERIFLKNGDDGATYTSDGVHPNAAGQIETARQWRITITGS